MNSLLNYFKILLLIFFNSTIGIGQNSSPTFHFDHLTINDGLSHNSIHCMLQDHYGYVWIGTQNGLNRYDGYSFEVLRSNQVNSQNLGLLGKTITTLYEDSNKNLWVGTSKKGINVRWHGNDLFENLHQDTCFRAIKNHPISSIYEDKEQSIWITTVGAGFSSYYTFLNGNCGDWSCKEDLAGLPCGDPNAFNDRFLENVTSNTTIKACFGNCADNGTCELTNVKSIKEDATLFQVNPTIAVNYTELRFGENALGKSKQITVMDVAGNTVYTQIEKNNDAHRINTLDLAKGVFFVSVQTDNAVFTRKFIVQ